MFRLLFASFFFMFFSSVFSSHKPAVWIISDGGKDINDPDDISAIAGYLLMSNHFDTRGIVLGSTNHQWNKNTIDQGKWANEIFYNAYKSDLANLNKYVGGFQPSIRFLESSIKGCGKNFSPVVDYDLKDYPSIEALYEEVKKSKEQINILCLGPLTEQAIFVSYCVKNNRYDMLRKVCFISHWTNSSFHVGTKHNPERTHNCMSDPISCSYMKNMALNGHIKFYECGGIGQYGIVENSPKGRAYYNRFMMSNLGKIYVEGKYVKNRVDDSDCATYLVLLGAYGVSLNDISSNGLNLPHVEKENEGKMALYAKSYRNELLRRSDAAAGINPDAVKVDVIVPEHGMADAHALVKGDSLYIICGHDESWAGKGSFRMDRWEIWSTVDLKNWTYHKSIYPKQTYIGDNPNCWAGDICERNGKYYWFFSNRNINTGVMESETINGDYVDVLGRPLLPEGIVPVHPYDPEIYSEDGEYHICFGAGTYYMAMLSEDMRSLASKPQKIVVEDENGKGISVPDKSTIMKRNGWYYLVFGSKYAMSRNLYGPYVFKGKFLNGGHTSMFEWHGQWYVLQENHDISAFYRGISLKPIFFKEDDTILVPADDRMYPGPGRSWEFDKSVMGWYSINGTSIYRSPEGALGGMVDYKNATIASAPWLCTSSSDCSSIRIKLKNNTYASKLRISIFSRDKGNNFWKSFTNPVDWNKQKWITIPIKPNTDDYIEYDIPLNKFDLKELIMQLALQPASDTFNGDWSIDYILIK